MSCEYKVELHRIHKPCITFHVCTVFDSRFLIPNEWLHLSITLGKERKET